MLAKALKLAVNTVSQILGGLENDHLCSGRFELHLKYGEHIMDAGGDVELWYDATPNGRNYRQAVNSSMPNWNGKGYKFDGNNQNMVQSATTTPIVLVTDFTIGFVCKVPNSNYNNIVTIADATSNQDFVRLTTNQTISIKADGETKTITLNSVMPDDVPFTVIAQRDEFNVFKIWIDGVLQSMTTTFSSGKPLDIDTVGCRNGQINDFNGTLGEIIIYACSNSKVQPDMQNRLDFIKTQMS